MEKRCIECGALIPEESILCLRCASENDMQTFRPRIVTNADRIRAMTDTELIPVVMHWVCHTVHAHECPETECDDCVMHWLKKEV